MIQFLELLEQFTYIKLSDCVAKWDLVTNLVPPGPQFKYLGTRLDAMNHQQG